MFIPRVLQLSVKKRYLYGAIAFIWIVIPSLKTLITVVSTDIVQGTCTRFTTVSNNYDVGKALGLISMLFEYWLPLTLMVFCYARVVRTLRSKVILPSS